MIEAYEVDAGISGSSVKTSGQCDSSLLEKSALLSFLIVPLITEERGRVLVVLQPARGGGLSACLRHESRRLPEAAKTIHQCQVSASNTFICESFLHIPNVDTLHFLRGSQKCFAGVSHNRS